MKILTGYQSIILLLLCIHNPLISMSDNQNSFDDVLLIINFNWPHYENIPFFKEIYGKIFPHMVFYGEQSHQEVEVVRTSRGYFAHRTLAAAMRKWPHFNGYLWINDDCFINFWQLAHYDKTKVWRPHHGIAQLNNLSDVWYWWHQRCGYAALKPAYYSLPEPFKNMIVANLGPLGVQYGVTEIYYFPARYKDAGIALCDHFTNVFLEIALPTICACMCPSDDCHYLNGRWTGADNYDQVYSRQLDFIHAIKASQEKNRIFMREQIKLALGIFAL